MKPQAVFKTRSFEVIRDMRTGRYMLKGKTTNGNEFAAEVDEQTALRLAGYAANLTFSLFFDKGEAKVGGVL